jgi:hypothetical protein
MGGTGKSELLNGFVGACDRLNISHAHLSTQDISDKFSPKAIKEVNAVIIEDAEFIGGKFGNDVNLAKVNALIDRQEITYNQKMVRSEQIRPNLSIIGSTNNRYSNRRYSVIVIRNSEIDLEKHKPPTPVRLVQAWMDAINFCPDPHIKFVSVKTKNQRSPFVVTDNMIKIFNLVNDDDSSFETVGMRKIIDYCTKGSVNPRAENIVKDDVRMLIKLGIANQIKKNPRWGLGVSKIEFDMFKFRDFIDTDETDEKSISVADVETAVINNYIKDIVFDSDEELKKIEKEFKRFSEMKDVLEKKPKTKTTNESIMKLEFKMQSLLERKREIERFIDLRKLILDAKPPPPA